MSLKKTVPWWGKIGAKVVLSRMPFGYRFWRGMNLFVHGAMQRPEYAVGVVRKHAGYAGLTDLHGLTVLELGPGDSVATAVIAKSMGSASVVLIDVGDFATRDIRPYQLLAQHLRNEGLSPPDLSGCVSREDLLERCHATYLTDGLQSLRSLPGDSVDFMFSHAVLGHVRLADYAETIGQTFRVTKPRGVASHQIDLRDHVGGALNHLRFSEAVWESHFMARSGFYTNRIRFDQQLETFAAAGWECTVAHSTRWAMLPTPRRLLANPFNAMTDENLLVADVAILARKP